MKRGPLRYCTVLLYLDGASIVIKTTLIIQQTYLKVKYSSWAFLSADTHVIRVRVFTASDSSEVKNNKINKILELSAIIWH
jgi:hypothetical protein